MPMASIVAPDPRYRTWERLGPAKAVKATEDARRVERDATTELVEKCRKGDSVAWQQLVESQHRRIYGLCYRFTGNAADADDLTQDVFIKLYKSLDSYDLDKGSFQTWISALTRNLLVDHFRRSKQDRSTESMDQGWEGDTEAALPLSARLEASGPSPHQQVASRETAAIVQKALTQVSPDLREAVILRDLQDMDYKEIAQILRVPEGTVKSRISRGRTELARVLQRIQGQVM
jgi:RNA polymerase sigma-70 factor, ECF subfamily